MKNRQRRKLTLLLGIIGAGLLSLIINRQLLSNSSSSHALVAHFNASTPLISQAVTAIAPIPLAPQALQQGTQPEENLRQAQTNGLSATPYPVIDEQGRDRYKVSASEVLAESQLPNLKPRFSASDLLYVLKNTRAYFQTYAEADPDLQRTGILGAQGVTVADVRDTIDFMIATLQTDIDERQPIRLQDPAFLNTHFRVIRWTAYNPDDLEQRLLRLTKYAIFHHPGSRNRTSTYNVPLYQLNQDAESDRFYLNYTKQQVLSGIYEQGGSEFGRVHPLAYLTRDSFEDALMQGTILVNFSDGSSAYFNVDRNNGIAYVPGVSPYRQGRYWYFKPVDAIKGYGYTSEAKISIKAGVTFAGDVLNIGLGRIVVLEYNTTGQTQLQLGVIADTGGAFLPNLHQLDFLAGVFSDRNQFYSSTSQLPEYTKAYLLIRKASGHP